MLKLYELDEPKTYVAHVERDLQVVYKAVVKFRKQIEHVEDVIACYFVKVAISQRSYVAVRLAEGGMDAGIFTKNVVLTCKNNCLYFDIKIDYTKSLTQNCHNDIVLQNLDGAASDEIKTRQNVALVH